MKEIAKREDQELINVIRNAAIKLWDAENGPEVRACLDELERRHCNKGSVLARLARVEEDLAAFKRAHDGHSHELRPFALHTLAPTPGVSAPSVASITDARALGLVVPGGGACRYTGYRRARSMINPNAGPTPGTLSMRGLSLGTVCLEITTVLINDGVVIVEGKVTERDAGFPMDLSFTFQRPCGMQDADALRKALHTFVCHEIDEQIKHHGARVFDPHL